MLTDLVLAAEAAFLHRLLRQGSLAESPPISAFCSLFWSIGVAAAAGGIMHGFYPEDRTLGHRILWPLTLLSAGSNVVPSMQIAQHIFDGPRGRHLATIGRVQYAIFTSLVLLRHRPFSIVVIESLPATLVLFVAFVKSATENDRHAGRWGLTGLALSAAGALVHRKRITLPPKMLTPDSLAHVLQAIGLACFYRSARSFQEKSPSIRT